ncbi:LysR family transcriptional regulator [Actinoplanes bogorensis]|uniref:LysR family transcriptional regulator n=1 Tax=Paractinoplanes bogorensis TaxID=1610840 RepID=A0ABS5YUZ0_9ACTN|nr:LysR family transcriptional regulator [Actinoplanes bogorensis]MBU2666499.1 LysR family transcriptional regulator [Actinoplanes bogorensis]
MSELETRQLRYFVAVAEELHFGRAAGRLDMAQPPLSKAIRDLERQLGVPLLIRTTRQVTLTPAGEALLADARVALDAVAAAARRARRAGQAEPTLRVALKADYDAGLLPLIVDAYDTLPIELVLGGPGQQVPALRDGRADVALALAPFDDRDMDSEPLVTGARVVALPAADPLAARTTIRLADLTGRKLPNGARAETGNVLPPPVALVKDVSQLFSLVEIGSIVWFLPDWVAERFPRPNIAYREVPELPPATLEVVWLAESRSPAVASFVRVARQVVSTRADQEPHAPAARSAPGRP